MKDKPETTCFENGQKVSVTIYGMDDVNQEVEAQYFLRNGYHYLLYKEVLEGRQEPFSTILKFKSGFMELKRQGLEAQTLTLEAGKNHVFHYPTAQGIIVFETAESSVVYFCAGKEMTLNVSYHLMQEDILQRECKLRIKIKE